MRGPERGSFPRLHGPVVVRIEVVSSAGAVDATPGPVLLILQSVNETLHLQTGGTCPGSETPTGDNPRDTRAALYEAGMHLQMTLLDSDLPNDLFTREEYGLRLRSIRT